MEPIQHAKKTTAVDLGALLDDGGDAVVTLVAGETRLVAHRAVLMDRSPVFSALFAHDTLENSSRQVTIVDVEGPALRQLLSYLYTLRAPQLPDMASQLLVAADKYGVASLKALILGEKSSTMEAIQNTAVDLGALLDACDDAVVTLVSGDTRLVAHRAVLMNRSHVFAAMFRHDTLEASSGQVTITDVEGPVLRQLLSYLYTLRAPQLPDIDMVTQLLVAADKYGVASLKAACEQHVVTQLSVDTAAAAAVLAVRHSCESLRQASITFLKDHTRQVIATHGWADAKRSQPDDLMEVNRLLVAEFRNLSAEERSSRLIDAAWVGELGVVEALLAAGANMEAVNIFGKTALHYAARLGHVEVARQLVARGAPVDARDSMQWTPLHWAAVRGDAAVVRLLLAASAHHSARAAGGWTPLHFAAYGGKAEVAAALLEAGADRGHRDEDGATPLDLAREGRHWQLVELLTRN